MFSSASRCRTGDNSNSNQLLLSLTAFQNRLLFKCTPSECSVRRKSLSSIGHMKGFINLPCDFPSRTLPPRVGFENHKITASKSQLHSPNNQSQQQLKLVEKLARKMKIPSRFPPSFSLQTRISFIKTLNDVFFLSFDFPNFPVCAVFPHHSKMEYHRS